MKIMRGLILMEKSRFDFENFENGTYMFNNYETSLVDAKRLTEN